MLKRVGLVATTLRLDTVKVLSEALLGEEWLEAMNAFVAAKQAELDATSGPTP